ncbi:polysaccharide export periplasmic protein [Sphingomonas sp. LH128]|uniref:polysaccharide biosynthesis/export family protein n=1 Tax=Sphingomonas sp. LH128 TaxID=473781 RepID=UPI00027C9EF6|nr:polysaccharide biosynthesis/export family protein [Sphingomonas sp. LH128]EJU14717.1 polysaccharide export periplasmic protein [Sphingomonas sp. LH128]
MPKLTPPFTILFLSLAASGCAAGGTLPELTLSGAETHYTLGAGDKLRITVYGEDKLTGEYPVDGAGAIAFPLIGAVQAKGLTASALADRVTAALSKGYIDNPSVSIDVLNLRPYYILGEVNKPGEFQFVEGLTVYSAVAKAEGFTYRADDKRIYIRHKDGAGEILYRLDGMTPIQPGDTIRVPERRF